MMKKKTGCFIGMMLFIIILTALYLWANYAVDTYNEPYVVIEQFIEDAKQDKSSSEFLASEAEWHSLRTSEFASIRQPIDWHAFKVFIQHSGYVWYETEPELSVWGKWMNYQQDSVSEGLAFYLTDKQDGPKEFVHLLLQIIDGEWKVVGTTWGGTSVEEIVVMEDGW